MSTSEKIPPMVDVKVTNPVTYFKLWWEKVMGKEGVYFSFRIHPITAFLIVFGFSAGVFSVGRYSVNIPFLQHEAVETAKPTATADVVWKETGFTGKLQFSEKEQRFFLLTTSSEAIVLSVPQNLDLTSLVGKRIFAIGEYNKAQRLLKVTDAKDLEVLSKTPQSIPTLVPTIEPTSTPISTTSATPIVTDTIETE